MATTGRWQIRVKGIVQGVGFRPFVFQLAKSHNLSGWVNNDSQGVLLEIEGEMAALQAFKQDLLNKKPPLARIDQIIVDSLKQLYSSDFVISASKGGFKQTLIAADTAPCADCLSEMADINGRFYQYPFLNCTNCGPRFTIIENLPYDRPYTTMKDFDFCEDCASEYADPFNRRFHAQPIACAKCGPRLTFDDGHGFSEQNALAKAITFLKQGKIVAIKGLGGYHLACDAFNNNAVLKLRQRKMREAKPFAIMMAEQEHIKKYCLVNDKEWQLLNSARRPIMLLAKRDGAEPALSKNIALYERFWGVMLPYTPLHYLLMAEFKALVMTSANISDLPLAYTEQDWAEISFLADACLSHNRPIFRPNDDSVMFYQDNQSYFIRRSRGFAPEPIVLPKAELPILALGGEQKNAFCLAQNGQAFLSQHIGELAQYATFSRYKAEIDYFKQMFALEPQILAYDYHPDYTNHAYAEQILAEAKAQGKNMQGLKVQHHHAHLAAVLAEYQLDEPAIGFIFDGSGYGLDGRIWGGETLIGDCQKFERYAHLAYLPLIGGEQAIYQPWRLSYALLAAIGHEDCFDWPPELPLIKRMAEQGVNTILSSGLGRLFDGVSNLLWPREQIDYEGQAAIILENSLLKGQGAYHFDLIKPTDGPWQWDWRPLISELMADKEKNIDLGLIAYRFQQAICLICLKTARQIRAEQGLDKIVLAGGCWQNRHLLSDTRQLLMDDGFSVYTNSLLPTNDGGLAFGQAAVAAANWVKED